jgi:predicted metal-dependent phosphoesterase TrpH
MATLPSSDPIAAVLLHGLVGLVIALAGSAGDGATLGAVLVDLHAHSSPRSSCSRASLDALVSAARSRGLDALCLTEHDVAWPGDELARASTAVGFPLFCGVELTTDVGHVLAFGPLRRALWLGYRFDELVAEAEETGAALVLPHPVRHQAGERAARAGTPSPPPEAVAATRAWAGVHAVEAASTQTTAVEQDLVARARAVLPSPAVAGSDAHAPERAGAFATRFERRVGTVEELAGEIRSGRVTPVSGYDGGPVLERPGGN